MKVIFAYIPVLHRGYIDFFKRHNVKAIFVFGSALIRQIDTVLDYLRKEIRALTPEEAAAAIRGLNITRNIFVVGVDNLEELGRYIFPGITVVMPDEDVSREAAKYLAGRKVEYDSVFLRWNKKNTTESHEVFCDRIVAADQFLQNVAAIGREQSEKSSDWWRRIGAVCFRDEKIIIATHNLHLPTPFTPYINGDPRNCAKKGVALDLYSSNHAEAEIVTAAAKQGISLDGAEILTTTFPCPLCAKLLARSGIKRLYFVEGYGVLDAEQVLKAYGVEIVLIK